MLSIPSKVQHKNTREFISEQIKPYPQTVNYTELRNKPTLQALFPRAKACTFPFSSSFRRAPARGCPLQTPFHVLPDYSLTVFPQRRGLPGRRPAYCPAAQVGKSVNPCLTHFRKAGGVPSPSRLAFPSLPKQQSCRISPQAGNLKDFIVIR